MAAYAYDACTNTIASSGTQATLNPWQYADGYKDTTTSLTKFGARYYDPTTGRFNQPDPTGKEQNNYLYAAANPVTNSDPSGLAYGGIQFEACAFVCLNVGFGGDGDVDTTIGFSVGAVIGGDIELGGGLRSNEGTSVNAGCGGSLGPIGGYVEGGLGQDAGLSGGAGIQGGTSLGCSVGALYTF